MLLLNIIVQFVLFDSSKRTADVRDNFGPQYKQPRLLMNPDTVNSNIQDISKKLCISSSDSNICVLLHKDINLIQSENDKKHLLDIIKHNEKDRNFAFDVPTNFDSTTVITFSNNKDSKDLTEVINIKSNNLEIFLLENEDELLLPSEITLEKFKEDIKKYTPVISVNTLKMIDIIENRKLPNENFGVNNDSSNLMKRCQSNETQRTGNYFFMPNECTLNNENYATIDERKAVLDFYLSKFDEKNVEDQRKYLSQTNQKILKSYDFQTNEDLELGCNLSSDFYVNLSQPIKLLESQHLLRLSHLFKYLEKKEFLSFLLEKRLEGYLTEDQTFINFFKKFFYNYELKNRIFIESVDCYDINMPYFDKNRLILIGRNTSIAFNRVFEEYSLSISEIVTNDRKSYFKSSFYKYFSDGNLLVVKCKFLTWITDLMKDKNNIIILSLFPEVKFFIEFVAIERNFGGKLSSIHIFFTYLVFKFQILKAKIKEEFLINQDDKVFVFTKSYLINYFFLEIRMFIAHFGFSIIKEKRLLNILVYKAFLNFLRLKNPEVFPFLPYDEFSDINKCTINSISQIIILHQKFISKRDKVKQEIKSINHHEIKALNKFSLDYNPFDSAETKKRISYHLSTCSYFKKDKRFRYDEINLLHETKIQKIHDELRDLVFAS